MKGRQMKKLKIINLVIFIACVGVTLMSENYAAASGWFVASVLQINIIVIGE